MRISDWSSDVCSSDLIVIAELIQARKRRTVDTKADTVAWYGADDLTRIALIDCIVVSDDLIDALHIAEHVEASMNLGRITGMDGLYFGVRSEERRVGKECGSTCRSRWSPAHSKKKKNKNKY